MNRATAARLAAIEAAVPGPSAVDPAPFRPVDELSRDEVFDEIRRRIFGRVAPAGRHHLHPPRRPRRAPRRGPAPSAGSRLMDLGEIRSAVEHYERAVAEVERLLGMPPEGAPVGTAGGRGWSARPSTPRAGNGQGRAPGAPRGRGKPSHREQTLAMLRRRRPDLLERVERGEIGWSKAEAMARKSTRSTASQGKPAGGAGPASDPPPDPPASDAPRIPGGGVQDSVHSI